jgi:hypothetical protein
MLICKQVADAGVGDDEIETILTFSLMALSCQHIMEDLFDLK